MTKVLVVLIFALLVLVAFLVVRNSRQDSPIGSTVSPTNRTGGEGAVSKYQPIVSSQANIDVEVTPINVSTSSTDFKVKLTTHSGSLDYDLLKQAVLNTNGQALKPLSWDGGQGSHHLLGTLKFPPLPGKAKSMKLAISGVGVPERTFEWNL